MISKNCLICNREFKVKPYRKDIAFYCSHLCYSISTKGKPTWNKGKKTGIIPKTAFKKGIRQNPAGEFKKGQIPPNYKGEEAGYSAKHKLIERRLGKPSKCEQCGTTESKRYEWANISGKYLLDHKDWIRLCKKCHCKYDDVVGKARKTIERRYLESLEA